MPNESCASSLRRFTAATFLTATGLTSPLCFLSAQDPAAVVAVRATTPPVLDGRDNDAVWQQVQPVSDFLVVRPSEGGVPPHRTEFKVAYDPHHLYVFVRAHDSAPDSIVGRLTRRDEMSSSDYITVMLDSYHDRRSGYEFQVNPAGVKVDFALHNETNEDAAWNAVWDVVTRIDSLGWTAEYRIPFSQLRYSPGEENTFGILVWRHFQRYTTQASWPLYRESRSGFVSQWAELRGLRGLAAPKRGELSPYVLTQNEPRAGANLGDRDQRLALGGDLSYALTSNFVLNATVNPDFGQVEADPGELNLSAFESFFSERRQFFVSGSGMFNFRLNCFAVNDCNTGEGLFYSRRIGRAPELGSIHGDAATPTSTRILGAAKLTGRLSSGLSIGFLDALTDRISSSADRTVEPAANYSVLRLSQDYGGGNGSIGAMVTSVHRSLDDDSSPYLHSSAWAGGLDARHRMGDYELSGALMASRVAGSAEAISRTQQRPAHYFQRPDDDLAFDPERTSLTGTSAEIRLGKLGGKRTRFETGYGRRSAGFELNDLGFLRRANEQTWTNWFAFRWNKPNRVYQRLNWNLNYWNYWTLDGLPTDRAFNSNVHVQFNNRWWLHAGGTVGLGDIYCDRDCTRGGPAMRIAPRFAPWLGIEGDDRRAFSPGLWINYSQSDEGRSDYLSINPSVRYNFSSRFSTSLSGVWSRNRDDLQWFRNVTNDDGSVTHLFAHLDQRTLSLTWRLNYTISPEASIQWYANPFISKGSYTRVRELADPRAAAYDDRTRIHEGPVADNPGGFNVRQFRSNAVFRWEYLPGSTLFLVWSQGRRQSENEMGRRPFGEEIADLFGQRADDRFLVKVSYWLNW